MVDLTIHHMLGSRSERVVWLAEELGIPYEVVLHIPNTKTGSVTSTLTDHVPDGKASPLQQLALPSPMLAPYLCFVFLR